MCHSTWLYGHHHLFLTSDSCNRETVSHRFRIGSQVGLDTKILLSPAFGDPEAGLDFIEYHHDPILITKLANLLQESRLWHDAG